MRVPVAWLREYCDPGTPAEEIADALTMAGLKVERLHRVGVGDSPTSSSATSCPPTLIRMPTASRFAR